MPHFLCFHHSVYCRIWQSMVWLGLPKTIFMEMVFRKKLNCNWRRCESAKIIEPVCMDGGENEKKFIKHGIFFLLAFLIAKYFPRLYNRDWSTEATGNGRPRKTSGRLYSFGHFTGVFYGVYARFREQACLVVCPYGRLQGVLLDRNSVVIAYDYVRGEPGAKCSKEKNENSEIVSTAMLVFMCAYRYRISETVHNWNV